MTVRSDKVAGIVTSVFGLLMTAFACFGLLILRLQRMVILGMPSEHEDAEAAAVMKAMMAIHHVWFIYLPLMILGGLILVGSGWWLFHGSQVARRIAQATALGGYVWSVAYAVSCYQIMDDIMPRGLPEPARVAFMWLSLVIGTLISAAFPSALLFLLSRPRDRSGGI